MDLKELLEEIPKFDDDRCTCEGCQVVYVRHLLAGGNTGICDCGCYSKHIVEAINTRIKEQG